MRRKNGIIRKRILLSLGDGPKTVNEIAREIRANWLTVSRHLEWLHKYKRKVRIVKKNSRLSLYQLWQ